MNQDVEKTNIATYRQAVDLRDEKLWANFGDVRLCDAVDTFLGTFSFHTQSAYRGAFRIFFKRGLLNPNMNLQTFSLSNLESLLDSIKEHSGTTEASKQSRAAAFVSFTAFLSRRTNGMVRKVSVNREKGKKTFGKIRERAATEAISKEEWKLFISTLKSNSLRDSLIARMLLQGAKRVSEVLEADISQINWERGTITFVQKKVGHNGKRNDPLLSASLFI